MRAELFACQTSSRIRCMSQLTSMGGLVAVGSGVHGLFVCGGWQVACDGWAEPPVSWIVSGDVLLVIAVVIILRKTKWNLEHGTNWVLYLVFIACFVGRVMLYGVM